MVELITMKKDERNPLFQDGDLLTYVQISGTDRGSYKQNVCLLCHQRCTIGGKPGDGAKNSQRYLETSGCVQPAGSHRLASLQHLKNVDNGLYLFRCCC